MSHIDSFKHELVGFFGGLPIYHPLEDIDGDFKCNPSQLVIGGGSGEHPALVIDNPTSAVAYFLDAEIDNIEMTVWRDVIDPYFKVPMDDILSFYEWNIKTYRNFYKMSKSKRLPNPCEDDDVELWLILGIGEFIFFSMPYLAKNIMNKLENPYQHFRHVRHNNITIVPPNFPVYANGGNMFFKK